MNIRNPAVRYKILMHKILLAIAALSFHLPAQATQITADDASRAAILTLTLEQVFDKPVDGGPSTGRPIVAAPDDADLSD